MKPPGDCWPTKQQELLLQAALLEGPNAIAAWDEWKRGFEENVRRRDSYRLLPLVYRSLKALGIQGHELEQLKRVYKLIWYRNRMQFHAVTPLLERLHRSGIRTMLLKGSSLVILYYGDLGVRTMTDTDILVREKDVREAMSLLSELGWNPFACRDRSLEESMPIRYDVHFENAHGQHIDLHWRPLSWYRQVLVEEIWDRTEALDYGGVSTEAPCPADQLSHILLHGVSWRESCSVHWVADAVTVVRSRASSLDWDRLVEQARRGKFALTVRHALTYLRDAFGAPVPDGVLNRVSGLPVSWKERADFRMRTRSCPPSGVPHVLHIFCMECLRFTHNPDFSHTPLGFLRYFQQRMGIRSLSEAFLTGARWAM
ncbi:nucleotidyltransferase family protein, partial [Verrucomicrobiota bacterium]